MQAIRFHQFGGPDVLQCETVAEPIPGPGEVRVVVHAAGVNPVDTYIRSGIYGARVFPVIPGLEAAGVVDAVGDGVTSVSVGARVFAVALKTGAYAEKALADASSVYPLPDALTFSQGAAVPVAYTTAYRALVGRANAKPGERVLIHGASGGVGIAAVQIARMRGLEVTGTASTPEGRALVAGEGAQTVLDHKADGYLDGQTFDVILEMLANVNLARDLSALNRYGRVVVIGSRGPIEINPRDTMSRDAVILGMTMFNIPPDELPQIHATIAAGLASGALKPVVGRTFPLAQAAEAHTAVLSSGALGKIVLVP